MNTFTEKPKDVAEILRKVQRIQIVANRKVNNLLAGQYHSVFRGQGMEFDDVREYQPGDEVRSIDWNVTARAGAPYVKRFREERELTVLLLVDVSASGAFGTIERSKLELVTEVAALIMFSALKNNDKAGLLLFCDEPVEYHAARKGKSNVLRLIRELLAVNPIQRPTNITAALDYVNRVQRRRAVVFLFSDFLGKLTESALRMTSLRHDLIAAPVIDPREQTMPNVGIATFVDPETGEVVEVDTFHPGVRAAFDKANRMRIAAMKDRFQRLGIDQLPIFTGVDYVKDMHKFFRMRERRFR